MEIYVASARAERQCLRKAKRTKPDVTRQDVRPSPARQRGERRMGSHQGRGLTALQAADTLDYKHRRTHKGFTGVRSLSEIRSGGPSDSLAKTSLVTVFNGG